MILSLLLCAANLTVAASDRLAMADRLFNRGEYARAKAEYRALTGSADLSASDLSYRLVACASALKDAAATRTAAEAFLKDFPLESRADKVRLFAALAASKDVRARELALLDREGVEPAVRAEALYRLGELTGETSAYQRALSVQPKGRFAPYAKIALARKLLEEKEAGERRKGMALLMELVYEPEGRFAKEALYLAAVYSYREARYGECTALLKRYAKVYPADARAREVVRLTALSELMAGKPASALACATDDSDETLLYVKALANFNLANAAAARAAVVRYQERFPQGPGRTTLETRLARLDFDEAVAAHRTNDILVAAQRCAALTKAPSDRLLVAWALENAGLAERAEAEYAAIAREAPDHPASADALYRRALSLVRRERWSAADLSLDESLKSGRLDPSRVASAWYWRGVAAFRLDHAAEGAAALKKALAGTLSLDEQREAKLLLADYDLAEGRTEDALAAYRDLIRAGAVVRLSAAKTLAIGRLLTGAEAKTCASTLIANTSAEWRQFGYELLGKLEAAEGHAQAAAEADRKCLAEPCQTEAVADAALRLGLYLIKDGQPTEAEVALKRAVELNAKQPTARAAAYWGLAQAAKLRGDDESARGYATILVTLFENSPEAAHAKELLK